MIVATASLRAGVRLAWACMCGSIVRDTRGMGRILGWVGSIELWDAMSIGSMGCGAIIWFLVPEWRWESRVEWGRMGMNRGDMASLKGTSNSRCTPSCDNIIGSNSGTVIFSHFLYHMFPLLYS